MGNKATASIDVFHLLGASLLDRTIYATGHRGQYTLGTRAALDQKPSFIPMHH